MTGYPTHSTSGWLVGTGCLSVGVLGSFTCESLYHSALVTLQHVGCFVPRMHMIKRIKVYAAMLLSPSMEVTHCHLHHGLLVAQTSPDLSVYVCMYVCVRV